MFTARADDALNLLSPWAEYQESEWTSSSSAQINTQHSTWSQTRRIDVHPFAATANANANAQHNHHRQHPSLPHHTATTKYTFVQISSTSLLLVSPDPDAPPAYHISTHPDVLNPSIYTTTLRRPPSSSIHNISNSRGGSGGSTNGSLVGFVRAGARPSPDDRVALDRALRPLSKTVYLQLVPSSTDPSAPPRALYRWSLSNVSLTWDVTDPLHKTCSLAPSQDIPPAEWNSPLATLLPPDGSRLASDGSLPPTELVVTPRGRTLLDHLVLSSLVIMRERDTGRGARSGEI